MWKVLQAMLVCGAQVSSALPAGGPLDDKHLLPEVSTLFMAGFESESALLCVACTCFFLPELRSSSSHRRQ